MDAQVAAPAINLNNYTEPKITFYRGLLDSLNITPEVWRVNKDGKSYKTAGDPLINTEMSEEMKENYF